MLFCISGRDQQPQCPSLSQLATADRDGPSLHGEKKVIRFLCFDLCKRPAQSVAWSTKILEVCLICEYPCGPHPVVGRPWGQESRMALKKVKWVSWRHQTGRWALGHICGPLQDTKSGTFMVWYKAESTLRCETFISEHNLFLSTFHLPSRRILD